MLNQLPLEIQSHIIGYNPYMQRLNKTYGQTTKGYFYEKFCDSFISQNEFVHYVKLFKPVQFALFVEKDDQYRILLFNNYNHLYQLTIYHFYIDNVDVEEYNINYDYTQLNMDTIANLFNYINHHFKYNVMYDVQLSLDILDERSQCTNVNSRYSYIYMLNQFTKNKTIKHGSDINTLFDLIKKILYMIVSYKIMNDEDIDDVIVGLDFSNIIFDALGQAIDDIDDVMNDFETMYNDYYQIFITHFEKEQI
jgi:hypothetical protein